MERQQKIISGGQTGVDQIALEIAHELGYKTGGYAPRTFRTENGPQRSLQTKYGLVEMKTLDCKVRSMANVDAADLIIIFNCLPGGSVGTVCTQHYALTSSWRNIQIAYGSSTIFQKNQKNGKKVIVVYDCKRSQNPEIIKEIQAYIKVAKVINFAGSRGSKLSDYPSIQEGISNLIRKILI